MAFLVECLFHHAKYPVQWLQDMRGTWRQSQNMNIVILGMAHHLGAQMGGMVI